MTRQIRLLIELNERCVLRHEASVLLRTIVQTGSIRQAALHLGYSYTHAWKLIGELNRSFDEPVTRAELGGVGGGGVQLTAFGAALLKALDNVRRQLDTIIDTELRTIAPKATGKRQKARGARSTQVFQPVMTSPDDQTSA